MEHGNDLTFTLAVFIKEIDRLKQLQKLIQDDHRIHATISKKLHSLTNSVKKIKGEDYDKDFNPEYSLTHIQANLNWLDRQLSVVPESQEIINEIEYVSKFLKDGKN